MPFSLSELCVHEPKTSPLPIKCFFFFGFLFYFLFKNQLLALPLSTCRMLSESHPALNFSGSH